MLSKAHGAAPTDRELKPLRDVMSPYLRALYEDEVRPMLDYFKLKQQLNTAQDKARRTASTLQACEDVLAESAADGSARAKWLQERMPQREEKVAKARQALAKSQASVAEAQAAFDRFINASGHLTGEDLVNGFKLMQRCPPPPDERKKKEDSRKRIMELLSQERNPPAASGPSRSSTDDDEAAQPTAKRLRPDTTTAAPFHLPLQGLPVDVIGCVASYLPTKSAVAGLACTCKALHAHVLASLTRVAVPLMGNLDYVYVSFPRVSHVVLMRSKGTIVQSDAKSWLKDLVVRLHARLRGLEVLLKGDDSRNVVALLCEVDWPKLELLYVKHHLALVLRAARARSLTFLPNLHSLGSERRSDSYTDNPNASDDEGDDRSDRLVRVDELVDARSKGHLPKLERFICRCSLDSTVCRVTVGDEDSDALLQYLAMCPDLAGLRIGSPFDSDWPLERPVSEADFDRLLTVLRNTRFPRLRNLSIRWNSLTAVQQIMQALNTSGTAHSIKELMLRLQLDAPGPHSTQLNPRQPSLPSLRTLAFTICGHVSASDVSAVLHACGSSLEKVTLKYEGSGGKRQQPAWLPAVLSDPSYAWVGSITELVLAPSRVTKIKEAELALSMKALLRRTVNLLKLTLPEGRDGAVVAFLDVLKEDGCLPRLEQVYMTDWSGQEFSLGQRPMPGSGASLLVAAWLSHQRAAQTHEVSLLSTSLACMHPRLPLLQRMRRAVVPVT